MSQRRDNCMVSGFVSGGRRGGAFRFYLNSNSDINNKTGEASIEQKCRWILFGGIAVGALVQFRISLCLMPEMLHL